MLTLDISDVPSPHARASIECAWAGFVETLKRGRAQGTNGSVTFKVNLLDGVPLKASEFSELHHSGKGGLTARNAVA